MTYLGCHAFDVDRIVFNQTCIFIIFVYLTVRIQFFSGDGELHEGANWEAIMFASQHKLDHLNLIVDNNQISMLGYTDDIISHDSLSNRLASFGWKCYEVDGHDVLTLQKSLLKMKCV